MTSWKKMFWDMLNRAKMLCIGKEKPDDIKEDVINLAFQL